MFKPGRGGAGRRPPAMRAPMPRRAGPGATSSSAATSSAQQQGKDESFSLESGGAPDFAAIIRLVPGLVEEIERLEERGGSARIKFGSNPMNPTENSIIEVGPKQYHFNWSAELGVCDIYEQVQNGEKNRGLLLEKGSAMRKMNVQRILDESAQNQVKMRSVQAELQSKSRKSIILDPAKPSNQNQVKSMAAAGVDGSMRRWGPKDKFKKSNQAAIAAPPPKKITITKTVPAGSPAQHSVETINPKNRNYDKRQTPVRSNNGFEQRNNIENSAELKTLLISILTDNPKGMSLKALEKAVGDSFPDSAKKIESIVKTIANFQAPGRYILKSSFASGSSKCQPSDNKSPSDNEDQDPILQALNEMEDYSNTPQNENNYQNNYPNQSNNNLNLNLEQDPFESDQIEIDIENGSPDLNKFKIDMNKSDEIDIEGGSPILNNINIETIDINKNEEIDIEGGSPILTNNIIDINKNEEIDIEGGSPILNNNININIDINKNSSSDDSDTDSDSDSSDNTESSPSRAGTSSQSDSENSSASDADADVEVNITSDNDEKETLNPKTLNPKTLIPTDLNLSPALKSVRADSPLINLNEDLLSTPVSNSNPNFGTKPVRETEFKRAGTSGNQKRVSTENFLEGSKRPKNGKESPFTNPKPSGSFQNSPLSKPRDYETNKKPVPKPSGTNSNNNSNSRAVVNEGFSGNKPLRKHTRENPNFNDTGENPNFPPVKRLRESTEGGNEHKRGELGQKRVEIEQKRGVNDQKRGGNIEQKRVFRREMSELELGEFREPSKSPDDEFKRLFGSSSSSKSDDINHNNHNNNVGNYDYDSKFSYGDDRGRNVQSEEISNSDRLIGTSGNNNNNNINNNNVGKSNNGKDVVVRGNKGVGPVKKVLSKEKNMNGEIIKGKNNSLLQNGSVSNNTNGVNKRVYSSSHDSDDYLMIYAKYDKGLADIKGPIRDFSKYKEYVNEYQEKYEVYISLNNQLEKYRDKYLKLGNEMETAKRSLRDFNKVVDKMREMYQQDKERREFLRRVFLILHEELTNLKQRLSDYYDECSKDSCKVLS